MCRFNLVENAGGRRQARINYRSMVRVLFIHSPADLYGASRSLLRLIRDMRKDGLEVGVVLPDEGALSRWLRDCGATIFIRPGIVKLERQNVATMGAAVRFGATIVADIWSQMALIASWRPNIVHTNVSIIPASAIASTLLRRPHLWHIRENFAEFPGMWRLYRHVMGRLATRIVCNSQMTARQLAGTRGENRARVVYNGLDAIEFCDFPQQAAAAWRRRLSPENGPLVGVVGRVRLMRKGQDVFVDAVAQLAAAHPRARFVCIGGVYPGNESHVEELLRRIDGAGLRDRFVVTGDIDDIGPATAALDIAVMPSVVPEPFGNVVMEAMCLGKPVIASSNGGAAEQIVDGETGILVPPGDSAALAAAIGRLLADPDLARTMGEAGRRRFVDAFSSQQTYAAIGRIYDEVFPGWRRSTKPGAAKGPDGGAQPHSGVKMLKHEEPIGGGDRGDD